MSITSGSVPGVATPERLAFASRVVLGAYYTDGTRLYETETIGATGCVVFRDCCTGWNRCLAIEDFRANFWLVKAAPDVAIRCSPLVVDIEPPDAAA